MYLVEIECGFVILFCFHSSAEAKYNIVSKLKKKIASQNLTALNSNLFHGPV